MTVVIHSKAMALKEGSILAFDISTVMGVTKLTLAQGQVAQAETWEVRHPPEENRFARWAKYARMAVELQAAYVPDLIVLEGYAYMTQFNGVTMAELGGAVRYALFQSADADILEVSPTTLKKFVAGKGGAKKDEVMLHLYKRWGIETSSNNCADATGLALIGAMYRGCLAEENRTDTEVMGLLRKPFKNGPPYMRCPKKVNADKATV